VGNDAQFVRLCKAIGREELATDERYARNRDRVDNRDGLIPTLQEEFRKRNADEWVEAIRGAGVPCGPVNDLAAVFEDEHVLGSGILQEVDHPTAGLLKMLTSPVLVDGERLPIRRPPPTLGQHTDEAMDGWS
jgi:crotonobetainyl-CoA:carnitine CoA-transferase CaiB-like acyl-CoA transferase